LDNKVFVITNIFKQLLS